MDTASIPATTIGGKAAGVGTEELRAEMYRARDELRAAGSRPPKRLVGAFAAARDAYHGHARATGSGS